MCLEDEEGAVEQDCEEAVAARLAAAVDEDTEEALPPTPPPLPPAVVAEVEDVDE